MPNSSNTFDLQLPIKLTSPIAEELNISNKSVSQILNGRIEDYSKETILKVYNLAREMTADLSEEGLKRIDDAIASLNEEAA